MRNQITKSVSISISDRIRLAKPIITSRDRVSQYQLSPSKSIEVSTNSSKLTPTKLLFRPKSFSSSPRDDESITARIRRQREEYLKSHPYHSPENGYSNKNIKRNDNEISPTFSSSSSPSSSPHNYNSNSNMNKNQQQ